MHDDYATVTSLDSLCTGCNSVLLHRWMHKINRTLQAYGIPRQHCVANSATGALPDILWAYSVMSCLLAPVVVL